MLDLGCVTGILSITSAKLGAEIISAVDHNSLAEEIAKRKCLINNYHFKGKRWYIISGLLGTEAHKILKRLQDLSINVIQVLSENSWFTILGKGDQL